MFSRPANRPSIIGALAILLMACACGSSSKPPETSHGAVALDEDSKTTSSKTSSATHTASPAVNQAMKAIEAKRFDKARDTLTEALAANDKDVLANFYLGVAQAGLGDSSSAISSYQKAIALDPKFAEAYVNLSALQLDAKDAEGALVTIEQGLKNTDEADLYLNRAIALETLGKKEQALAAYAAAVKHIPDNLSLRVTYAQLLASSGKKEDALTELRRVRDSGDPKLLAIAAIEARQLGAFADCVAILDRAIAQKDLAPLHVRRGMCREDLKDDAGAKNDYERAIAMDPKFAPAHYYLGVMLRRTAADKKKACPELQAAMELGGTQGVGPEAKKAVVELGCH
jgi:tetratricopeptide (TPR) repeat protein